MKRAFPIEGFTERVRLVLAEWEISGKKVSNITDYMGIRRNHIYDTHTWGSGKLARFCAVTGESADWILGLRRDRK